LRTAAIGNKKIGLLKCGRDSQKIVVLKKKEEVVEKK
jgi:hypothetical protein